VVSVSEIFVKMLGSYGDRNKVVMFDRFKK